MSKIVYKIELPEPGEVKVYSLTYAFITKHVALQNHKPMWWFEVVVDEQRSSEVEVTCIGTGWPISTDYWHIGTIVTESGFVWHFYAKYINDTEYE